MAKTEPMTDTLLLLRQQHGTLIPIEEVASFFKLTVEKLKQKTRRGEIQLPIVRMTATQKSSLFVPTSDFARYLDEQIEAARKECRQLNTGSAS
jgi:hypothetical protein